METNSITLTFSREKETKNTVRFQEDARQGQPPVIGTLYVQRWFAGEAQQVAVTIKPVAAQPEKAGQV